MRKPLLCSSIKVEDMTSSNQSFDVVERRVDKVCKILSSPLNKKKTASAPEKTFGVSLEELLLRKINDNAGIPYFVKRICEYIESSGFHHEGLFRVNGSLRNIEKLRLAFDHNGDANLEEMGDVMAAASLLKQFLRTLPSPVIPVALHDQFVHVQREYYQENEECIRQLKRLVEQLPKVNFNLLKYLMDFLVKVADAEEYNRMNANSLGIVFGPSIFRVSDSIEGLREQGYTNQIVAKFIKDYSALFEDQAAPFLHKPIFRDVAEPVVVTSSSGCRPSPRLNVSQSDHADGHVCVVPPPPMTKASAEHSSIARVHGTVPIVPRSEREMSHDDKGNELVELTISNTISHHVFGENSNSTSLRLPSRLKHKKLELSPDGAANSKLARSNSEERSAVTFSERPFNEHGFTARKCNSHDNVHNVDDASRVAEAAAAEDKKQVDSSSFMKKFEAMPVGLSRTDHQVVTPLNIDTSSLHATPDLRKKDWGRRHDSEHISEARRSMERLQNFAQFQRSTPPKSRKIPPLKSSRRCVSMEIVQGDMDEDSLKENIDSFSADNGHGDCSRVTKQFQKRSSSMSKADKSSSELSVADDEPMQESKGVTSVANAGGKTRLWLLDLHAAASSAANHDDGSSPLSAHKPYIPPLDLSKLHEHGDGSDPIPTNQLRASWPFIHSHQMMDDEVMLSPRTKSVEKKSSAFSDSNIPPSPPVEWDKTRKSSSISLKDDEEREAAFRFLNKKISSIKRKIKQYEDGFEEENGYRPSHAEKMCSVEVKKYLMDLVKARKELKQLKEEERLATIASSSCTLLATQGGVAGAPVVATTNGNKCGHIQRLLSAHLTIQESLDEMMIKLAEKRKLANRTEALEDMTRDQIVEEKLVIQKALLHFEDIHGRPTTKQEKEIMKPIYERYRNVKRLATKASAPKIKDASTELQPILEHETMDFTQASPKHHLQMDSNADDDQLLSEACPSFQNTLAVGVVKNGDGDQICSDPEMKSVKRKLVQEDSFNLHELSHEELLEQEWKVRSEKKRIRRILREFEEEFQRQTGRKAQREDRVSLDSVYLEYKQVKAKLKLLEALLTKHEHHYTI